MTNSYLVVDEFGFVTIVTMTDEQCQTCFNEFSCEMIRINGDGTFTKIDFDEHHEVVETVTYEQYFGVINKS